MGGANGWAVSAVVNWAITPAPPEGGACIAAACEAVGPEQIAGTGIPSQVPAQKTCTMVNTGCLSIPDRPGLE